MIRSIIQNNISTAVVKLTSIKDNCLQRVDLSFNNDVFVPSKSAEAIKTKEIFQARIEKLKINYPKDYQYLKEIAESLNQAGIEIKENELYKLAPLVGEQEFEKILYELKPEEFKTGKKLENVQKGLFRANMHIHTTFSDGKMSVEEVLDQASRYSNKIARIQKSKGTKDENIKPFVLAITDHDRFDGTRKAIIEIIENPDKFKNVRFVPAGELTALYMNKDFLKAPVAFDFEAYCVNPFNKEINRFLELVINKRFDAFYEILDKINEKVNKGLSLAEAKKKYPDIKSFKDKEFRLYISEKLEEKNLKRLMPDCEKIFSKYDSQNYIGTEENNKIMLKIINEVNNLDEVSGMSIEKVQQNPEISKLTRMGISNSSFKNMRLYFEKQTNLDLNDIFNGKLEVTTPYIDKVVSTINDSGYGITGFAHPARINIERYIDKNAPLLKDIPEKSKNAEAIGMLLEFTKNELGVKVAEINYQYDKNYQGCKNRKNIEGIVGDINRYCEVLKLLPTGGSDAHKNNMFCGQESLDKNTINKILDY